MPWIPTCHWAQQLRNTSREHHQRASPPSSFLSLTFSSERRRQDMESMQAFQEIPTSLEIPTLSLPNTHCFLTPVAESSRQMDVLTFQVTRPYPNPLNQMPRPYPNPLNHSLRGGTRWLKGSQVSSQSTGVQREMTELPL